MNEDDEVTGFHLYRVAYDHDRVGWCVWEQIEDNRLDFTAGPFDTEKEANEKMKSMNNEQGVNINEHG